MAEFERVICMSFPTSKTLLHGQHLSLTPTVLEDLQALESAVGVRYLRLMMAVPAFPPTLETIMENIKTGLQSGRDYCFTMRLKADHRPIGLCSLQGVDLWTRVGGLSIGIMAESDMGHGYGRDAMTLLLNFAFWEMNLHRVWLEVADYNIPAKALYESLGFVKEVTRRQLIFRDGKYFDAHIMSLLANEWASPQAQE